MGLVTSSVPLEYPQGWYPTGQADPSNVFNPSNALVKAMIIASGTAMVAYDGTDDVTVRVLGSAPGGSPSLPLIAKT